MNMTTSIPRTKRQQSRATKPAGAGIGKTPPAAKKVVKNSSRENRPSKPPPTPDEIAAARKAVVPKLNQADAAGKVYVAFRTWQEWEQGRRPMPAGLFELFQLKTGQVKLSDLKKQRITEE